MFIAPTRHTAFLAAGFLILSMAWMLNL